jgi:hypothetical protein
MFKIGKEFRPLRAKIYLIPLLLRKPPFFLLAGVLLFIEEENKR